MSDQKRTSHAFCGDIPSLMSNVAERLREYLSKNVDPYEIIRNDSQHPFSEKDLRYIRRELHYRLFAPRTSGD